MSFFNRMKRLLGNAEAPTPHSEGKGEDCVACRDLSCMEAMAKVQEYLDGELDGVSHGEMAHHFDVCQRCYPHLRLEERFREVLHRSQAGESCPEALKEQVLQLLAAEAGKRG